MSANAFALPSDSQILVDACVARVREAAHLHDAAVLPPATRREIVVVADADLPSARSIAQAAARANVEEKKKPRASRRRASTWPVWACGMVAVASAFAAWATSPAGQPTFERAAQEARGELARAAYVLAGVIDPS